MYQQGDLFEAAPPPVTGRELRDIGMRIATESAEKKNPGWGDKCFELLKKYLMTTPAPTFQAESFRIWAHEDQRLEYPHSGRAYGGVITRAAKAGLIVKDGIGPVSNPRAHCANASIWKIVR